MRIFRTSAGALAELDSRFYLLREDWDSLINRSGLYEYLNARIAASEPIQSDIELSALMEHILAPIGQQEVWAAGVTYLRSKDARMEESKKGGGSDFYQKVYEAERPELFFKALPHRVAAPGEAVYIRKDSTWNVPEPEFTLYINSAGEIVAYTIGNDMSSRSIEGENPLYLPQAKSYERSAALGPCLYVPAAPLPPETTISILITRGGKPVFHGEVPLSKMKRSFPELAGWLYRECRFAHGCFLMTGTGIVPPDDFTLQIGDRIAITVGVVGTLVNVVGVSGE